jgi:hypothetical protein
LKRWNSGEKITVVYPSASKMFEPINENEKQSIKNKYSEAKNSFYSIVFFPDGKIL